MKKRFKVITIIVIILILGILILFCSKVGKISLIENIRQKIAQTEEIEKVNEITTIDVTYLEDGGMVEHEHTFKTMYDENKHWEECTLCGKRGGEVEHTYTEILDVTSLPKCHPSNCCNKICKCGYSYKYHEPCAWNGTYRQWYDGYNHIKNCSKCNGYILYDYYYNGILYKDGGAEFCIYRHNGSTASCNNTSGTCRECGYVYKGIKYHIADTNQETGEIKCVRCNSQIGEITTESIEKISDAPSTYIITNNIALKNGAKFSRGALVENWNALIDWYDICDQKVTNMNSTKTQLTLITTIKFKKEIKNSVRHVIRIEINMDGAVFVVNSKRMNFYQETVKPTIANITMGDGSEDLTEWSRTKPILISGTENWCDVVNVKIVDDKENVVFSGDANVVGNNYSVSCTPEVECDTNVRTFKVIVTDTCENSVEQEFTIAKVDSIAPRPKSDTEILGDWAKSKNFTFKATDGGIGNVFIAFNDIEDLQLANSDGIEYSRDYEFVGDVYRQKELSVLYRDGLGNTSMQKIIIDKIDNTAPTILETKFHNNKLIIKSNDEKEGLGEGSGVVKYRYFTSREKIENPEIPDSAKEVDKDDEIIINDIANIKYVYVVAEDYVGNVSKVYEVEVPKLVLTSEVQLDGSNGKGAVKLDWSSYDIEDKYFVIYRKEENAEEWKTIVSLDEKFNGSSYIDNLANDKKVPNDPNIVINGNQENNSINIVASSTDKGSKYTYYIEAYDNKGTLINISNTQ